MNKRTLIIIAGVLTPIIALALLAQSEPTQAPAVTTTAPAESKPMVGSGQTLEEARERAKLILDTLNKMTPEEWAEQQKRRLQANPEPAAPASPQTPPAQTPPAAADPSSSKDADENDD